MIKVPGKGRACILEGLIKAQDVYINCTCDKSTLCADSHC